MALSNRNDAFLVVCPLGVLALEFVVFFSVPLGVKAALGVLPPALGVPIAALGVPAPALGVLPPALGVPITALGVLAPALGVPGLDVILGGVSAS